MAKKRQVKTLEEALTQYDKNAQWLKQSVEGMELEKSRDIFIDWVRSRGNYLFHEDQYTKTLSKAQKELNKKEKLLMRTFSPREVVLIDFGYNIGAEYGGEHYAVVMKNASPQDQRLYVIPLRSDRDIIETEPNGYKLRRMRPTECNLGKLPFLNVGLPENQRKGSLAKVMEATPVSKLRLVNPNPAGKLDKELFEELKNKWLTVFFPEKYQEIKDLKKELEEMKSLTEN